MTRTKVGSKKRWLLTGLVTVGVLFSFMSFSGGCQKKETAAEKAGREAREAFEKGKELFKEGLDKTRDLTKEGLEKGSDAAKDGIEKSQDAAKAFSKGWSEGGKK